MCVLALCRSAFLNRTNSRATRERLDALRAADAALGCDLLVCPPATLVSVAAHALLAPVLATPALRALKARVPQGRLTVLAHALEAL